MNIQEIRQKFPQYDDLSDGDLLMGLHRKFYSDVHPRQFLNSIDGAANAHVTIKNPELKTWWTENVQKPMGEETPDQMQARLVQAGEAPVDHGGKIGTAARSNLQGLTFGHGDEIVAAGASLLGPNSYEYELDRERRRLEQGREENPVLATGSEIAGAVMLPIPAWAKSANRGTRIGQAAAQGGILGGIYGFGSGEGGLPSRLKDAGAAAATGFGIGGALQGVSEGLGAIVNTLAQRRANTEMIKNAPSREAIGQKADNLYAAGRATGQTAAPNDTQALANRVRQVMTDEGLITPKGTVLRGESPLRDVLSTFDDYADEAMTPTQMQKVRSLINDAINSGDDAQQRVGMQLKNMFDEWVDAKVPEFSKAYPYTQRLKNNDLIDQTIELAGIRAGQFSGSGYENALRTEFRALSRKIAKGQLKGLTQTQIDAINKIAEGGPIENIMRDIGKAAPRGVVSAGLGGGVPYVVGETIGGPVAGGIAAGTALGAGEIGRRVATAMQGRNAEIAAALMRTGGIAPIVGDVAAPVTNAVSNAGARLAPYLSEKASPAMRQAVQALLGR